MLHSSLVVSVPVVSHQVFAGQAHLLARIYFPDGRWPAAFRFSPTDNASTKHTLFLLLCLHPCNITAQSRASLETKLQLQPNSNFPRSGPEATKLLWQLSVKLVVG